MMKFSPAATVMVMTLGLLLAGCKTPPVEAPDNAKLDATPGEPLSQFPNIRDRVFFSYDSAVIAGDDNIQTVRFQADWLMQHPAVKVTIEGHADERGTREYNLALGERRAVALREALVALGIAEARMTMISYGKERPAVVGSNEAAWQKNRRAVAVIN